MAEAVRVYAGTWDGVSVLSVRGHNCEVVERALQGGIIGALAGCRQQPERVFVGVVGDGLYRTDDAGRRWRKLLDGDIRSAAIDPSDDRVVYAGTDPVRLYRSEDGGDSWEEIISLQRLPEESHHKLGEVNSADMENYDKQDFRHRRQDWWFPVPPHQGHVLQTFIHPDDPNLLLLSIEHGGVARSADRGHTWEDVSQGIDYLDIHHVASLPRRFDRYVVSSARGFYASDDPGNGWARAENGCTRSYFHDILFLPRADGGEPTMIVASADGSPGFWPATRVRMEWDHSARGSRAALFKSDDGAQSWQRLGVGGGLPEEMDPMIWALCRDPVDPDGIFAGIGESSTVPTASRKCGQGSVMASADRGETWSTLQVGKSAVEHVYAAVES